MAASGICAALLARFGGRVICRVAEAETVALAKQNGTTRSDAAMARSIGDNIGIVAIGNAPTALLKVMELIEQGLFAPDLVIGVPVGFVNAAESKELLARKRLSLHHRPGPQGRHTGGRGRSQRPAAAGLRTRWGSKPGRKEPCAAATPPGPAPPQRPRRRCSACWAGRIPEQSRSPFPTVRATALPSAVSAERIAMATVVKDAGDDPDVTNGAEIGADGALA